jgi:hypothetical protein
MEHSHSPFSNHRKDKAMIQKLLGGLALIVLILVAVIFSQPDEFRVTRSLLISAKPETIFNEVIDLHRWEGWSPWAKLDPNAKTTFEGPASGNGTTMKWDGNDDVGAGLMTITQNTAPHSILYKIEFLRPMQGINTGEFNFKEEGSQTRVTWSMYGQNSFIGKAMGLFFNCSDMVGEQFAKGLSNLKQVSESKP